MAALVFFGLCTWVALGLVEEPTAERVSDELADDLAEFRGLALGMGAANGLSPDVSQLELRCLNDSPAIYPGAVVSFDVEGHDGLVEVFADGLVAAGYLPVDGTRNVMSGGNGAERTEQRYSNPETVTVVWMTTSEGRVEHDVSLTAQPQDAPC